jgi:hypothetical protein
MDHDQLLHQYIRSDRPPSGQWHIDIPSRLSIVEDQVKKSETSEYAEESFERFALNRAKEIDGVCITSQPQQQNLSKQSINYDKDKYINSGVFDNERVILVEAKTSIDQVFKGIGQLKAYSTHFRNYWDAENVEELLVLLDDEPDDYIKKVRKELPVRFVDIPDINSLS